jgi:2-polyprenyl-3-methyl-5-hydroxy-6-metoxy-1,4-benzoquinol methylase
MQEIVDMEIQKEHYDRKYDTMKTDEIINKVSNLESFLSDAIRTDTSWHGIYYGSFRDKIKNKRIIELGSGDGLNALIMAALGAEHVVAIDISTWTERIINDVNLVLGLPNIEVITGDFEKLSFKPRSFDFVIGKAFLHHLTHDIEDNYVRKIANILKLDGETRFFEPAVNNRILDWLRWIVPVPGRPSLLNRTAFLEWKKRDPHPDRDNSSRHYVMNGKHYFNEVEIVLLGSIERFHRLIPSRKFRQWAHKIEPELPYWFRYPCARSQLIIYRQPKL